MGRSHPVKRVPDRPDSETSLGITEHIPSISGHIRAYSGHIPGITGHCHVRYRSSRAVSSVAGSRAVGSVAPSRVVMSRPVSATSVSLPCPRSNKPNARRRPCPGPTAACSRRRHRRYTNIYSFVWPWRFIVARSAARLRRIVGPQIYIGTS